MKKRWLLTSLFALALCVCAASAQAAVTSGGRSYLWNIEVGEIIQNENYEPVSYTGDSLWISQDGGISYAELPGLREESQRTWGRMDAALTPLENGGLRVEARDGYGTEFTWTRDYSAAELNRALAQAKPTPVTVMAANENVAVGSLLVYDQQNGDPSQPGQFGWGAARSGGIGGYRMAWSSDGVTWTWASEQPEDFSPYRSEAWWDGTAFYLTEGYTSADGDHWIKVEEVPTRTSLAIAADLGRYHFELVLPNDSSGWYNEVYLMEGSNRNEGVLLPHVGEAIRARGIGINSMIAAPGPNETVILTVSGTGGSFSLDYPISSLDWCLENLSKPFRESTDMVIVSDGTVSLAKVAEHFRNHSSYEMEGELIRNDGSGWKKVEYTPFSPVFKILPYNGKTFMALDNTPGEKRLYASTDGLKWVEVAALRPQELDESDTWGYANYTFLWTGANYYAGLKAGVSRHGMMGHAGGGWYGKNTEVWLLNEAFEVIASHDFGRLVEKIGYLEGVYYAQVSNSERTSDSGFSWGGEGSILYRSTDGKTWEPMGPEYTIEENTMGSLTEIEGSGDVPEPQEGGNPLRSVAVLDRWRFTLCKNGEVYLLKDSKTEQILLPHIGEAIRANWITPGELTATYNTDGTVKVEVADRYTPSMRCSISYPTDSLDWVKENLEGVSAAEGYDFGTCQFKSNTAEIALVERNQGEREVVYRNNSTEYDFACYDSVPWSNNVAFLPYTGHEFIVQDQRDGKVYLSPDAITWREAQGDLFTRQWKELQDWPYGGSLKYSMVWTGSQYVVSPRYYENMGRGSHIGGYTSSDSGKVFFLDEELNVVSSHDFDSLVGRVGYADGVYYAEAGYFAWDRGRYSQPVENVCYRSTDGVNWQKTDAVRVRECLRDIGA